MANFLWELKKPDQYSHAGGAAEREDSRSNLAEEVVQVPCSVAAEVPVDSKYEGFWSN
jgi:hypothetical protein